MKSLGQRRKLTVEIKWFDLWIGAFWDRKSRTLYVCPLPCVVFVWRLARLKVRRNGTEERGT